MVRSFDSVISKPPCKRGASTPRRSELPHRIFIGSAARNLNVPVTAPDLNERRFCPFPCTERFGGKKCCSAITLPFVRRSAGDFGTKIMHAREETFPSFASATLDLHAQRRSGAHKSTTPATRAGVARIQ